MAALFNHLAILFAIFQISTISIAAEINPKNVASDAKSSQSPRGYGTDPVEIIVDWNDFKATGGITQKDIQEVSLRTSVSLVKQCYKRNLEKEKGLAGKLIISWRTDLNGKIRRPQIKKDMVHSTSLNACLRSVLEGKEFQKFGKVVDIQIAIVLQNYLR